jgi:hypothetical protein
MTELARTGSVGATNEIIRLKFETAVLTATADDQGFQDCYWQERG